MTVEKKVKVGLLFLLLLFIGIVLFIVIQQKDEAGSRVYLGERGINGVYSKREWFGGVKGSEASRFVHMEKFTKYL